MSSDRSPPVQAVPAEDGRARVRAHAWRHLLIRRIQRTGEASVEVRGGSMRPLLRSGWRVRLRPIQPDMLRPGMVLAVALGDQVVVHRIVRVEPAAVQTWGDAVAIPDPPVPLAHVVGLVDAVQGPAGLWVPILHSATLGATLRLARRGRRVAGRVRRAIAARLAPR
jgi:hypothetical protein